MRHPSGRQPTVWRLGLRARMVALAVLPTLLVALMIGAYAIYTRFSDAAEALAEQGQLRAQNLAMASELPLLAQDSERLRQLCEGMLQGNEVVGARLLDVQWQVVVRCGDDMATADEATPWRYRVPIGMHGVEIALPGMEDPGAERDPLGWAEVRLSATAIVHRERQIMRTSLLIIALGVAISLWIGFRLTVGVSRPLLALREAMRRYRRGEEAVTLQPEGAKDVAQLAEDFNRMAQTLDGFQAELQRKVAEATAELEQTVTQLQARNRELDVARAEALQAGQDRQDFLARMSHEIRTPLNAMVGFSRLLVHPSDPERIGEYGATVQRAADQLLTVIDGVLNFTRLQSGSLPLEEAPFDPGELLEDALAIVAPAAHEKGLELVPMMHSSLPGWLSGDRYRLTQVVLNLLDNAIKFTPTGHVLLEAKYVPADADAGRLVITVEDSGIGIPTATLETIFQPFHQVDPAITRQTGGSGLGLAICLGLIRLMGGQIDASSQVGRGSRFRVEVPLQELALPVAEPAPRSLAGHRVLIYDAHPVQLRALRARLLAWHINLHALGHVAMLDAALQRAAAAGAPFEVVVLGLSPTEAAIPALQALLQRVRAHHSGPVLLLVGAETWCPPRGLEQQWLSKPCRRGLLASWLCRLMSLEEGISQRDGLAPVTTPTIVTKQSNGCPPTRRPLRALVVEDNAFNRELLETMLRDRGVEVASVDSGGAAIARVVEQAFDILFMDIHMPVLDGVSAARRLREDAVGAHRPLPRLLALTADVFVKGRQDEAGWPFEAVLLKPITDAALDQALAPGDPPGVGRSAVGILPLRSGDLASVQLAEATHEAAGSEAQRAALPMEVARLLDALSMAMAADEFERLRELAHELKGLAGMFGLEGLAEAARTLESGLDDPVSSAAMLREAMQRARTAAPTVDQAR